MPQFDNDKVLPKLQACPNSHAGKFPIRTTSKTKTSTRYRNILKPLPSSATLPIYQCSRTNFPLVPARRLSAPELFDPFLKDIRHLFVPLHRLAMEHDCQAVGIIDTFSPCLKYEPLQAFAIVGGFIGLEMGFRTILRCGLHERDCEFYPDETVFSRQSTRGAAELWNPLALHLLGIRAI